MTQQEPMKRISPLARPQRRRPMGNPIEWTEQDLDDLSTITMADIKAADAVWKSAAPAPLKKLLDAEVEGKNG